MDTVEKDPIRNFTHDLNNLLVGIDGYARLLSQEPGLTEEGRTYLFRLIQLVDTATDKSLAFQRENGVRASSHLQTRSTTLSGEINNTLRVLVIDDDPSVREVVSQVLSREGISVTTAIDGQEGLDRFQEESFDCVLLDLSMPIMSGNLVFARLKALSPDLPIIIMSALITDQRIMTFSQNETTKFIQKPFNSRELLSCVKEACAFTVPTRSLAQNG